MSHDFVKMHGLGNDFVIVDGRTRSFAPGEATVRTIADRRLGIGCDQLVVLEQPATDNADVSIRIWNADGGEVPTCGNATRCVASLLMAERGTRRIGIQTQGGLVLAERDGDDVSVDMGPARADWQDIPLSSPQDTDRLRLALGPLADPVAVNVGNPHAVFFVQDVDSVPLEALGPLLERDPLFPERTNVEVAQVLDRQRLRMRVWERGAGITRACGSGACAAVVAGVRRGLVDRRSDVVLDGGVLRIEWREDGHVMMAGPAVLAFSGRFSDTLVKPELEAAL